MGGAISRPYFGNIAMLNDVDQNMINTVVNGVVSSTLTLEQENEYINLSTPYDNLYTENNFNMYNWIQDGDEFPINDLCYWDSYLDEDWLLGIGFTEDCLSHWSLGKTPTIDEYKKFLRPWIKLTLEQFDYSIFPIASPIAPRAISTVSNSPSGRLMRFI